MKLAIILLFALYACVNGDADAARSNFVESYESVVRVFSFIMTQAENAQQEKVSMYFSMVIDALLDLGRKYYASPKQYSTTYLPISVGCMNEVRESPENYIKKQKKHYSVIYTNYIKLISDLFKSECKPEDMPSCNKNVINYIKNLTKEEQEKYNKAVQVLFKASDIADIFVESSTSIWNLASKNQPLVRFLTHSEKSLPVVQMIAEVYKMSHGPIVMLG